MAITITFQDHTRKKFANKEVDLAQLKVMLRTGDTSDTSFTTVSQFAGSEVSGNGWTAGGESIANAAVTITTTNQATLDGDDIIITASGGTIGPTTTALLIDDTDVDPVVLFFIDFDGSQEAGDTTEFQLKWDANGITRWISP